MRGRKMKIKDYRCKCGKDDFFFADKGNQKGIYCSYCGKWFKWADKDEQNLAMKQEPTLDELRAEITTLQNRCYALTKGTMCAFCRYECEYKPESEK